MNFVDVIFPASGELLPADHSYTLYTALTRVVPEFHRDGFPLSFAWINGLPADKGMIRLFERSSLRCRVPAEHIATVLPLTGKTLQVAEHPVRLGIPRVAPLSASPSLMAKMATFKHGMSPERFLAAAREKLRLLNISDQAELGIPLIASRERQGEPRRRILRVKGRQVVGYSLLVTGLTAEESLRLQEAGLGGRRRMGCGFFLPWKGGA
jgi:CRISPR-associated protein Cas6